MAVYYKFKSAKEYDSVSIDGHFISVGNLKDKIIEKKNLGRGSDFDLLISNPQTDEEYTDDAQLVPKNTSVLIRRVPGRRQRPIVAEVRDEKAKDESSKGQTSLIKPVAETPLVSSSKQLDDSDWADEFGVDLYTMPEQPPPPTIPRQQHQQLSQHQHQHQHQLDQLVNDKSLEEDNKIKAFVDASASDWQRQTQESLSAGRGMGRGSQGRGVGGRGFGRGFQMDRKNPPPGYVCHRCGVPGHFIQHCPTNGDPAFDVKKMKPPTGIPKSMLVVNPDGSYALPSGAVAVLKPNEAVFEKEIEGLPSSKSVVEIPPELRCPLCNGVLKDAVLTSRCCFNSYCDKCIRDHIISKGKCVCGATHVLADDLLPNKTLRDAINRLLESTATTSSAEHGGSLYQVQDMESARPKPKPQSPSASASQKTSSVAPAPVVVTLGKQAAPNQEREVSNPNQAHSHKGLETIEHTAESNSRQELVSQVDVMGYQNTAHPVEEEVQQENLSDAAKKKKLKSKRQKPLNGEKDDYRDTGAFDLPVDGSMMHYPGNPAMFGNYWGGHQFMLDAYGMPIPNPQFPYFGYGLPAPVPCDMPFGVGMMMPDPVGHPLMMPPVRGHPRDGAFNSGSSVMSREEFEARKAELRRKRDLEQKGHIREDGKNTGSGDPGSSKIKKSNASNSSASSIADEFDDGTEKKGYSFHNKTSAAGSNSMISQGVKRKLPERNDEPQMHEPRMERKVIEPQRGMTAGERSEKKPSVFSRISFPDKSPERPKKKMSDKLPESRESEGNDSGSLVSRSRRHAKERLSSGLDAEEILRSPKDSVKISSSGGRKASYKDEQLRSLNRGNNKIQDEYDATDDDNYERNFKRRASYSTSPIDMGTRNSKRR